jgi:site-specific DNA-cytosine methylase
MRIRTKLSLCDGLSGSQIAGERIGLIADTYIASEIDPYAIKITQKNYPNTIQVGDMNNWRDWDIDWHSVDLVIAGFPCQSWSVAGKGKADRDPRGQLFWVVLDIMQHVLSPRN